MRPLLPVFFIVAIVLCGAGQDVAPDTQIGDYRFFMPRGWNRVEKPAGTVIYAPLTAPSMAYIALLHTVELPSTLRAAFDEQWRGFAQPYRILQGGHAVAQRSPHGYDAFTTQAIAVDQNGTRWRVFVLAAQNGKRLETVMFMSNAANPELNATLQNVLDSFLRSLRFATEDRDAGTPSNASPHSGTGGSSVTLPPRSKGRLNGIYRAVGVVNYGSGQAPRIGWRYVAFFPDGRFMEGFPDQGMDNLDEDAEIRRNPVGWGSYDLSGERGKITFIITDPEHEKGPIIWDLKEYTDHLSVDGDTYTLLGPVDGLKLEGTFRREDYKSLYAGSRQGITFTPDGQFVDEGVLKAAAVMIRRPGTNASDFDDGAPGRGTYRISNYTLELKYSNGVTKRTSIFLEPGAPKSDVRKFYLNTYSFVRIQ
ncbi:MAG: hypothetical protein WA738_11540 [Candidatus Angelobacter sp.]